MSSAISPLSSPVVAIAAAAGPSNDAKVQDAALQKLPKACARIPFAKALNVWTGFDHESALSNWFTQDLENDTRKAERRILECAEKSQETLDLSDLKNLDALFPELFELPHLKAVTLAAKVAHISFHYAILRNDAAMCGKILRLVPKISRKEYDSEFFKIHKTRPLDYAIRNDRPSLYEELLRGVSKDEALQAAAKYGNKTLCKRLIQEGADPFAGEITPLEFAAGKRHLSIVKLMLSSLFQYGDLTCVAKALYRVMKCHPRSLQEDLAKELLRYLRKAEALNLFFEGDTLLTLAVKLPAWNPLIPLLLEMGADASICDANKASPLSLFMDSEEPFSEEIFPPLLEATKAVGALDLTDCDKWTALMWACHRGRKRETLELLRKGADLNVVSSLGFSALLFAIDNADTPLAQLLLAHGACWDPNTRYARGTEQLTLIEVAKANHMPSDVIQFLQEALPVKQEASAAAAEEGSLSDVD